MDALYTTFGKLQLDEDDVVTFYIHEDGRFHQHTRYMKTNTKPAPSVHPEEFGVLGRVWKSGWHFNADLPDPKDSRDYCEYVSMHYNITRKEIKELSRKYRAYYGLNVSWQKHKIGVLLVESMLQKFDEDNCKAILEECSRYIEDFWSTFQQEKTIIDPAGRGDRND